MLLPGWEQNVPSSVCFPRALCVYLFFPPASSDYSSFLLTSFSSFQVWYIQEGAKRPHTAHVHWSLQWVVFTAFLSAPPSFTPKLINATPFSTEWSIAALFALIFMLSTFLLPHWLLIVSVLMTQQHLDLHNHGCHPLTQVILPIPVVFPLAFLRPLLWLVSPMVA